mmetsp:Transcript_9243/g.10453  ORF Transcript_9243/g.10453 Transcript_9243/m.10453 type:complete len:249 (+) Transcript_9243:24-770(+)
MNKFTAILFLAMIVGSALGDFPIYMSSTSYKQSLHIYRYQTATNINIDHREGVKLPETAADISSVYYVCGVSSTSTSLSTDAATMSGFGYLYSCNADGDDNGDCSTSLDQTKLTLKHFTLDLEYTLGSTSYKGASFSAPTILNSEGSEDTEISFNKYGNNQYSFSHEHTDDASAQAAGLPTTGDEYMRCYIKYSPTAGISDLSSLSTDFDEADVIKIEEGNNFYASRAFFTASVTSTAFIAMLASFIY